MHIIERPLLLLLEQAIEESGELNPWLVPQASSLLMVSIECDLAFPKIGYDELNSPINVDYGECKNWVSF
jgi:hypothetical protein